MKDANRHDCPVIRIQYPDGKTAVMDGTNSDWIVMGVFPSCPGPADTSQTRCDCKGGHNITTDIKCSPMIAAFMICHLFDQVPDVERLVTHLRVQKKTEDLMLLASGSASKEAH